MPERVLRKYGEEAVIDFTLFQNDGIRFQTDASHVAGDTKISKDEAAEVDTSNSFVDIGTGYSLTLDSDEMQAKRLFLPIVDQGTPQWRDEYIMVETFGHTDAQQAFNLDADLSTNTETWKFKEIDIHNDAGIGLTVESDTTSAVSLVAGGDGNALDATGGGSGHGFNIRGGASHGAGIKIEGGSTSGAGIEVIATNGTGIDILAGTSGYGIRVLGAGTNPGIYAGGFGTGGGIVCQASSSGNKHGLEVIGGGSGAGFYAHPEGLTGIGAKIDCPIGTVGLEISGNGANPGVKITGGATGNGVKIAGGATSGNGIDISAGGAGSKGIYSKGKCCGFRAEGEIGIEILGEGGVTPDPFAGLAITGGSTGGGVEITSGHHGISLSAASDGVKIMAAGGTGIDIDSAGPGITVDSDFTHAVQFRGGSGGRGLSLIGGGGPALFLGATDDAMSINSTAGNGIAIASTSGNALDATGGGSGDGFNIRGGPTGNGVEIVGGTNGLDISTISGYGVDIRGSGSRSGLHIIGGTSGKGMEVRGGGASQVGLYIGSTNADAVEFNATLSGSISGSGLKVTGAGSDHGAQFLGGASGGDGFYCAAQGGNGNGASFHKDGSGKDMDATELDGLLKLTTIVDSTSLENVYELMMSRVNGEYVLDTPAVGNITMYKRDNVTPVTVVNVTTTGRTRIL